MLSEKWQPFYPQRHCDDRHPVIAGLDIDLRPAKERRRYFETTSLIDRIQA